MVEMDGNDPKKEERVRTRMRLAGMRKAHFIQTVNSDVFLRADVDEVAAGVTRAPVPQSSLCAEARHNKHNQTCSECLLDPRGGSCTKCKRVGFNCCYCHPGATELAGFHFLPVHEGGGIARRPHGRPSVRQVAIRKVESYVPRSRLTSESSIEI